MEAQEIEKLQLLAYDQLIELPVIKSGQYSNVIYHSPEWEVKLDRMTISDYGFDTKGEPVPTRLVFIKSLRLNIVTNIYVAQGQSDGFESERLTILAQEKRRLDL